MCSLYVIIKSDSSLNIPKCCYFKELKMDKKLTRRDFIKTSSVLIAGLTVLPSYRFKKVRSVRFGWVTDIHYAEAEAKWNRYYNEGLDKLKEVVDLFNEENVDFAIETGDFKDQHEPPVEKDTLSFLKAIEAEFSKFHGSRYHVLGNHDMDSLSKDQFMNEIDNTGIEDKSTYYFFDRNGIRFVVLDACFTEEDKPYNHNDYSWKDTNIPQVELNWLENVLKSSDYPVCVFAHQLLDNSGDMYVNNSEEVRRILEKSKKVFCVLQGHMHEGDMNVINDILYFTQKALVEGSGAENNSYSIVTVNSKGEVLIEGYRKAQHYERSLFPEEKAG